MDAVKQDCLPDLISLNARKHNLPNFFNNLLNSGTEFVEFLPTSNSIAVHFEELHFTQAIELFEIFTKAQYFSANIRESSAFGKEVCILAEIFSKFLLHVKIFEPALPPHIHQKYGELIQVTFNKLKNNSHVLLDEDQVLLQRAHLLLCNVVGKAKLTYDKDSTQLFDFLTKQTKVFEVLLNGKDEMLSLLVFQLLILKIEGLILKKQLSEVELAALKTTISIVLQHAEANIHKGASWDMNLNTLSSDNYGTAVWRKLFEILPLILDTMNYKEHLKICGCFREIILHGNYLLGSEVVESTDLTSIVLFSLQSAHFQESKCFQSTLISTIWNLDSFLLVRKRFSDELESKPTFIKVLTSLSSFSRKWQKYEESTPKSRESKDLNPLWSRIKEICSYLNEILSNSIVRTKLNRKIYDILQLIDCVTLRHLPPANQVKCVIGLSTLFFLVPESCQAANGKKIAEKIAKQLITIFDGERSVWLMDFVASGPYLKEIMNTIERLAEGERFTDVPDCFKLLLKHLINLITKNSHALLEAKDYFPEESCLNNVVLKFFGRVCKNNQHIASFVTNDFHSGMWESIYVSLQKRCSNDVTVLGESQYNQITLTIDEVELLQRLFPVLSPKELNDVFDELCNRTENWNITEGNIFEMNLNIIKEILDCDSLKKEPALCKQSVMNLLSYMCCHVRQAEDTILDLNTIKIPVFCFFNFMIKQKKSYLCDDHWMDCLHICMTVNLNKSNLQVFLKTFDAVWNPVYNLLVYHPEFILKTTPVFMMIVTNLLKSLVQAGSEDAVNGSAKDIQHRMVICSQNMARLLTMLTRHKSQFSKLVPFVVGDYADSVQHNTLEVNIKGNLIAALNCLLQISNQNTLKMVYLTVNHKCREIFSKILREFDERRYRGYI